MWVDLINQVHNKIKSIHVIYIRDIGHDIDDKRDSHPPKKKPIIFSYLGENFSFLSSYTFPFFVYFVSVLMIIFININFRFIQYNSLITNYDTFSFPFFIFSFLKIFLLLFIFLYVIRMKIISQSRK